jgi:hypothetical protein
MKMLAKSFDKSNQLLSQLKESLVPPAKAGGNSNRGFLSEENSKSREQK